MFLIPFFLLLFNGQLKAADDFNARMGITYEVLTVGDIVNFLDQADTEDVISLKTTAFLLSAGVLIGAVSLHKLGSCPPPSSDMDGDTFYSCSGWALASGLSIGEIGMTCLFRSGAVEKIFNWYTGKCISWNRFPNEAAKDQDIREVRKMLMQAQSPLLKKLKPNQMLLLIPQLDEFKKCTEKKCFSKTSMVLANRFIRMLKMNKKELMDELGNEEVQKEIAESCNKKRFYYLLHGCLPEDKRCEKLKELVAAPL
jgi:hypothetical protein